jgi:hypothetical protein
MRISIEGAQANSHHHPPFGNGLRHVDEGEIFGRAIHVEKWDKIKYVWAKTEFGRCWVGV